MKFIKWKTLAITNVICLLPILLGVILWDKLPDIMAIHFDIYNNPDNFAPKGFVVFVLPLLMAVLQTICCFGNDVNAHKHGTRNELEKVTKWIIPAIAVILQILTLGYGLGWKVDIRRAAILIVAVIFLVLGKYLPEVDYIKNYDVTAEKARKINRFIGYETVVMGLLALSTIFMPPIATIVWIALLIPYVLVGIIYGIKIGKK